ncbi:MAG: ABC transporter permease [Bacteroidaceae bacterium]|nr:ABC transporter permease [Bacteroidaceae bacterium]MBQ9882849.1 ABC transporter permease [Bacteroidaceae bacterium]
MKSYLKFLSRNKLYTAIEAVGLAVSLAFVILIGSYAWQQWAVTQEHPDREHIYTFNLPDWPGLTFGFAEKLADAVPEVEQTARYCPDIVTYVHVDDSYVEARAIAVDPSFFQMFPYYGFLEGTPESLATKEDVFLSESFARTYHFKVGDVLHTRDWDFRVAGIVEDFRQTLFPAVDIIAHPDSWLNAGAWEQPFDRYGSTITFARVTPETDRATLQTKTEALCKEVYPGMYGTSFFESFSVERLDELFFKEYDGNPQAYRHGDLGTLRILLLVGLLLLISAIFNYINLSFALTGKRAKEMATRRLLGEEKRSIVLRQITESILFTAICFGIGLLLAYAFVPTFNSLINNPDVPVTIFLRPSYVIAYLILIILTGTISGILPALLSSKFSPIDVVRGTFRRHTKMTFSKVFILLQNALAVFLLAMAIVMEVQYRLSMNRPLHANIDDIYYLRVQSQSNQQSLADAFSTLPCVKRIGFSQGAPGARTGGQFSLTRDGDEIMYRTFKMDSFAFDIFHFEKLKDYQMPKFNAVWFGESAFAASGFDDEYHDISQTLSQRTQGCDYVAGVIKDFPVNLSNAGEEDYLFVSVMKREDLKWGGWVIETIGDHNEARKAIRQVYEDWNRTNIASVADDDFLSENFREALRPARNNMRLLELFMLLAIMISLLGLLAMSTYFAGERSKDIAVRKVFGSTVNGELWHNVREYMVLVGIACLIGIPLAIWAAQNYLESYIYRLENYWWIFALAVVITLVISFLSVLWQTLKAARTNPATELKKE